MESIQKHMSLRAVVLAGLVAGTVFLLVGMLVGNYQPDNFLSYMASIPLGVEAIIIPQVDSPTMAASTVILVGLLVHYLLSLLFALVIAIVIHRWGLLVGIVGGALLGLALYGINFFMFGRVEFFPQFYNIIGLPLLVTHVVFGAVAGGVYEMFDSYDEELELTHDAA